MKKLLLCFSIWLVGYFVIGLLQPVSAHIMGQPPFFTENGKLSGYYHVPLTTSQIPLPLDSSPEDYVVGQRIDFKIEPALLPYSPEQLKAATLDWDFGDGAKGAGLTNSHAYKKPGSYIVFIIIRQPNQDPFMLQATLVNVKPSTTYELPIAKIAVNGQKINDPLSDVIYTDFNKPIEVSETNSTGGASKIKDITWVFEETTQHTPTASYQFSPTKEIAFALLRITTDDGFLSDAWVQLTNTSFSSNGQTNPSSPNSGLSKKISDLSTSLVKQGFNVSSNPLLFIVAIALIFIGGGLHAITPGHGKSLMGVYLLGKKKGKFSDVLLITLSITFTHTIAIFVLGFIFLALEHTMSINQVVPYFEKASALIVVFLAVNLIQNGYRNWRHMKDHEHGHEHHHDHHHDHEHMKITSKKDLLLVGVSGGILPCVDAFAILALAAGAGKVLLGIFMVVIFSLGLASTITLLGYVLLHGKDKLKLEERFGKTAEIYGPLVSGSLILIIALRLLLK